MVGRNRRRGQIPALDPGVLRGAKNIGLTGGAPAPEFLVEDALEASPAPGPAELTPLQGVRKI
jgi:4-hydroxy-3-methylbut-2-enyl diphosphate reductase IspH